MIFLNHCGVSRMHKSARDAAVAQLDLQAEKGALMFADFRDPVDLFREAGGRLLETSAANVSYVRNTSEGLGLLAAGYPVKPGDEIISYEHEYPANHYPWRLMEKRGAKLVLVPNSSYGRLTGKTGIPDGPCGFSMEDLESRITPNTRIIALSHVQFPSGFAADLALLGKICRERGIDLIVDAAQSLGMRIRTAQIVDVQRHTRVIDEALEKFVKQIDIKIAHATARKIDMHFQTGATGKIDHHTRQRFIERHIGMAVTANTFFIAHRLRKRLPQCDANIFYCVVIIDMHIALRSHIEINQAVARNLVQHMLQKWHWRFKVGFAGAIEIDSNLNLRFQRVALDTGFAFSHGNLAQNKPPLYRPAPRLSPVQCSNVCKKRPVCDA
jgi:hypothetical protein